MPEEHYRWLPSDELLSIAEFVRVVGAFGVDRVRITGGEPLIRQDVDALVSSLRVREVALTTNGVLLASRAEELKRAGLHRITVSLDTLRADRFEQLTRRNQLNDVLAGIAAARSAGFSELKLDCVVMRGVNDDELHDLLRFAREVSAELRFIEYMDVGGATRWSPREVVSAREILERVGPAKALDGRGSAPAQRYEREDGQIFGIIGSTTAPFCGACDRARVTADGTFFSCLYAKRGVDLRSALRAGVDLVPLISAHWSARTDRGAEERLALRDARGPLFTAAQLQQEPHAEMHTRGG